MKKLESGRQYEVIKDFLGENVHIEFMLANNLKNKIKIKNLIISEIDKPNLLIFFST